MSRFARSGVIGCLCFDLLSLALFFRLRYIRRTYATYEAGGTSVPRQKRERKRFSDVDCDLEIFAMDLREGLNVKNVTFEGVTVAWSMLVGFTSILIEFV